MHLNFISWPEGAAANLSGGIPTTKTLIFKRSPACLLSQVVTEAVVVAKEKNGGAEILN